MNPFRLNNDLMCRGSNGRAFLKGLASLPLAVVLADPALAQAAGNSLTRVAHKTSSGIDINAFVALPKQTPAPCVLLVHEWWGLNDQIKSVAAEFANRGYRVTMSA